MLVETMAHFLTRLSHTYLLPEVAHRLLPAPFGLGLLPLSLYLTHSPSLSKHARKHALVLFLSVSSSVCHMSRPAGHPALHTLCLSPHTSHASLHAPFRRCPRDTR